MKQLKKNLQPFPAIHTNTCVFFSVAQVLNAIHSIFCWLHISDQVKNIFLFHRTWCYSNKLKTSNNKLCLQNAMFLNSFVWPCTQTISSTFIKVSSSIRNRYICRNTESSVSAKICFGVTLITVTHTHI